MKTNPLKCLEPLSNYFQAVRLPRYCAVTKSSWLSSDVTQVYLDQVGSGEDAGSWFRIFLKEEVGKSIVWPVSLQRQDRLGKVCRDLTTFHQSLYPAYADMALSGEGFLRTATRPLHAIIGRKIRLDTIRGR